MLKTVLGFLSIGLDAVMVVLCLRMFKEIRRLDLKML